MIPKESSPQRGLGGQDYMQCIQGGSVVESFTRSFNSLLCIAINCYTRAKCPDEEHITYSGGSKIKDLAQCG